MGIHVATNSGECMGSFKDYGTGKEWQGHGRRRGVGDSHGWDHAQQEAVGIKLGWQVK